MTIDSFATVFAQPHSSGKLVINIAAVHISERGFDDSFRNQFTRSGTNTQISDVDR